MAMAASLSSTLLQCEYGLFITAFHSTDTFLKKVAKTANFPNDKKAV